MKDLVHLSHFLGKRVAVQDEPKKYAMLILYGILANGSAIVGTSAGHMSIIDVSSIENPYMIIDEVNITVEYK